MNLIRKAFNIFGLNVTKLKNQSIFNTPDFYSYNESRRTRKPIGPNNEDIPWITYPSLEFLSQINFANLHVFEFGAGHSSVWFSNRAASVTSVESDKSWILYLQKFNLNKLTIVHKEPDAFTEALTQDKKTFDVILIDSHKRLECCDIAVNYLSENGFIIFDNSERHPDGCKILRDKGLLQVDFKGFGPINEYTWCTSIFFSSLKNHNAIETTPSTPLGGIGSKWFPKTTQ